MIVVKINLSKIDKSHFFKGAKGLYLDLILMENDGTDQYGNDFMVVQGVSKEARQQGVKGPIVGNGKHMESRAPRQQQRSAPPRTAAPPPPPDDGPPPDNDAPWER